MLILSRQVDERILVTDGKAQIWLTICRIQPGKVRIGIDAPGNWTVSREELLTTGSDTDGAA